MAACFGGALPAKADTFSFAFSGGGVDGSGTFTTTASSTIAGAQNVIGATGFVEGLPVSLVAGSFDPANPTTLSLPDTFYFNYDDVLYPSGSVVDENGILLELSNGDYFNLFQDPQVGLAFLTSNGNLPYDQANIQPVADGLTISPVSAVTPEPASILLLGTGLLGAAVMARRRFV